MPQKRNFNWDRKPGRNPQFLPGFSILNLFLTNYAIWRSLIKGIRMIEKKVIYYTLENGNSPFKDWLKKLDNLSRAIVVRFIQRVATGGARKSVKALKDGIFEIKITHGPGYRVYFAEDGNEIIILLVGGDKKTQTRDIDKAKEFWRNYGKQT